MAGNVIGKSLGFGYPGSYARTPEQTIRTFPAAGTIQFGDPVKLGTTAGTAVKFSDGTTDAESFIGIAARRVQSAKIYPAQNIGEYSDKEPCDVLIRGSVTVMITPEASATAPVYNGKVYLDTATGAFYTDESEGRILLPNAKWGGGKDTNGICELIITDAVKN